ncbi:retrovirus-related pol polyprotein from transposon TNT 1-94, partial [Tanacetum coccineum]
MTRAKFDIEKFDGTGDFGLWKIKMHALLIQHGCEAALEVLPADMEAQTKVELNKKAHSDVILCLGNKVPREVTGETTATGVWSNLETLYMTKSLANKLYPKKKLYTFYMPTGRKISEHIDEFNKIVLDLTNIEGFTSVKGKVKIEVKVINGFRVVLSGIRSDNCVYSLDGHAMTGELNASAEEKDDLAQVWHKRLRHISEAGLNVLEKQGLFGKKSLGKLDFCDNYVLGKSHRVRSVWVYIVRFKHEAFGKFKEWKQLVENQTGRTVKKLRTDNGLEFFAGTPQHNGPAERMNRTLMDKVRCLLIQSGLPKTFWVEATYMAAYLINRSPSTTIEKKTPTEMCLGHPSDYEMLRIFDCVAYPHDKQGKLDPRAVKCVLLGYPEGVKGYRLYRLDNKLPKIVTNRNVIFNESVMYKDTLRDSDAGADNKGKKDTHEPLTYQEAFACEDSSKWKAAMKEEMDSLRKNKTWELVDHLAGQKLREVTACKDYELEQLDVKTTFYMGILKKSYAPGEYIYLLLYVDDMLIACKSKAEIGSTKSLLKKEFDMKELGEAKK